MPSPHRVLEFSQHREPASDSPRGDDLSFVLDGPSAAMQRLRSQIQRVAPYFRTALLAGEQGTGAYAVAQALYRGSPLGDRPLRVLPASAVEVSFAFGDIQERNPGSGVVFLPKVEQLSSVAQRGILRLLRLRKPRAVCVIAAASQDLRALVSAGSFNPELAAALGALRLDLPPLRSRLEDVPLLMHAMVERTAKPMNCTVPKLGDDFLRMAIEYSWRRNLDQMQEMVSWLLQNRVGELLTAADFEAASAPHQSKPHAAEGAVRMVSLDKIVQEHLRVVLMACHGNKLRAAEVLGISRSTLYRMLEAGDACKILGKTG